MKQFSCGDVVPGCGRRFRGSEAEILSAVGEHAVADHGLSEVPPSLVAAVREHMVPA